MPPALAPLRMSTPVRLPVTTEFRNSTLPAPINTPNVFNPPAYQSVVLLPARVTVNPSITTPAAVTSNAAPPEPPIGPDTVVVAAPAPSSVTALFTTTSSAYSPA